MFRTPAVLLFLIPILAGCQSVLPDSLASLGQPDLYADLTDEDVALAAAELQIVLETTPDGQEGAWQNTSSGHGGTIRPIRTHMTDTGYFCRDYHETLNIDGRQATYANTACRNDDARWVWVE